MTWQRRLVVLAAAAVAGVIAGGLLGLAVALDEQPRALP